MTRLSPPKYAPGYDLFKLLVAIILTIIFILLLLRIRCGAGAPLESPTFTPTQVAPTLTATIPSTLTASPAITDTPAPTLTPTATVVQTDTVVPSLTPSVTPTLVIATPAANTCPSAVSRIHIGDIVRVNRRLNLRTGPGRNFQILLVNDPSTRLEVIGGPVCTTETLDNGQTKAHLWWQVRMSSGQIGWSAEGQLIATFYLLEPIR